MTEHITHHSGENYPVVGPAPQIIHTSADLEDLDGETIIGTKDGYIASATELRLFVRPHNANKYLPAVVIGDGSHVRYCWTALEGETK